jgi:hypothetical protein
MKSAVLTLLAILALGFAAGAADRPSAIDDAVIATKAAQVETLRARLSTVSSLTASTSLIEAESLLRQLRAAPAAKRAPIAAQLDAALARTDLEIDAAGRKE